MHRSCLPLLFSLSPPPALALAVCAIEAFQRSPSSGGLLVDRSGSLAAVSTLDLLHSGLQASTTVPASSHRASTLPRRVRVERLAPAVWRKWGGGTSKSPSSYESHFERVLPFLSVLAVEPVTSTRHVWRRTTPFDDPRCAPAPALCMPICDSTAGPHPSLIFHVSMSFVA